MRHASDDSRRGRILAAGWGLAVALTAPWAASGCRDALNVSVPAGLVDPGALSTLQGAEALRLGALGEFARAVGAYGAAVDYTGLLSDEFSNGFPYDAGRAGADARHSDVTSAAAQGSLPFDGAYETFQKARITAVQARIALAAHASMAPRAEAGQMFAVEGFSELLLAEAVCSGVPLAAVPAGSGVAHGVPLTTDSLLGRAAADFDSALAYGAGNDTVTNVAHIGLARTLMDRQQYALAAAAAAQVPTAFEYDVELTASGNFYTDDFYHYLAISPGLYGGGVSSVADRKGGNGLDYISAGDPRLPIDSSLGTTAAGTTFYYPAKFALSGPPTIPVADGKEARLIEAEAAMDAGNAGTWLNDLNALRADSANTHVSGLSPLADPSADTARISLTFRERAFWLFGTAHRLGDLRRLVRQYGRDPSRVFAFGPYPPALGAQFGISTYGSDLNFPIGAVENANPNFHGCLNRDS